MDHSTRVLCSRRVATPAGIRSAAVLVRDGLIAAVLPRDHPDARHAEDLGNLWLLPGLVDTHVHANAPGRDEWEGFETAARAAAAGGVTTIVDMPLNAIPATTSAAALAAKLDAARGRCHVDVGFWGGVVPGNAGDLEPLASAGVLGFKCFLSPSGVPEFGHVSDADLDAAAPVLARLGLPLLAHAEDPVFLRAPAGDPRHYRTWLASRPEQAEVAAVRRLARLAARGSFPVHVVHVACGEVIDEARRLGAGGVPISLETCPHYLWFAAEDIPDAAPAFKCAPPIRQARHRSALWDALREGEVTIVASDHSPCPPALKAGADLIAAWGGIASLELGLAAVWTGARMRGFTPADLARWMSEAPARLAGLVDRKGAIAPGYDADLIAFDPAAERTVDPTRLQQRHPVTPYAGCALAGRVVRTWLRGEPVWDGEQVAAGPPRGRMLLRGMERAGAVR